MSFDRMYEEAIAEEQARRARASPPPPPPRTAFDDRFAHNIPPPPRRVRSPAVVDDLQYSGGSTPVCRSGASTPMDPVQVIHQNLHRDPVHARRLESDPPSPAAPQHHDDDRHASSLDSMALTLSISEYEDDGKHHAAESREGRNSAGGGEEPPSSSAEPPVGQSSLQILQDLTGLSEEVLLRPMFLPAHDDDWRCTLKTLLDVLQPSILSSGFLSEEDQINFSKRTKMVDTWTKIDSTLKTMEMKVSEVKRRFYLSEVAALKVLRQTKWNVESIADIIKLNKNFPVVEHPQLRSVLFSYLSPEDTLDLRASNSHIKQSVEDYVSEQCVEFTAYMMTEVQYVPPKKILPSSKRRKNQGLPTPNDAFATPDDLPSNIPHPVSGSPLPLPHSTSRYNAPRQLQVGGEDQPIIATVVDRSRDQKRKDLGDGREATVSYSDGIKFMAILTKLKFQRRQEFIKEILSRLGILEEEDGEELTSAAVAGMGGDDDDDDDDDAGPVRIGGKSLLDLPLLTRDGKIFDELLQEEYASAAVTATTSQQQPLTSTDLPVSSRSATPTKKTNRCPGEDILQSAASCMRCIILQFDIPSHAVSLRDVITPCFRLDQLLIIGLPKEGSDMVLADARRPEVVMISRQPEMRHMPFAGATTRSRMPVAGRASNRFQPNEELITNINHAVLFLSNCYLNTFPKKLVSDGFFPHSLSIRELPDKREDFRLDSATLWCPVNHISTYSKRGDDPATSLAFLDLQGLKGLKEIMSPAPPHLKHQQQDRCSLAQLRLPVSKLQKISGDGTTLDEVMFKKLSFTSWSSLTSIPTSCFAGHGTLVKLDLSAPQLDSLPSSIAARCPSLTTVSLEGALKLESIGNDFAANCPLLVSVTLPRKGSSLKSVGENFLRYCPLLRQLRNMEFQTQLWSIGRGFCNSFEEKADPSSDRQIHYHPRISPSSSGRLREIDFTHCDPQVLSRFDILTSLEKQQVKILATEEQLKNRAHVATKDLKKIPVRYTKSGVVQKPGTTRTRSNGKENAIPQWKKDRDAFFKKKAAETALSAATSTTTRGPVYAHLAPTRGVARSPTFGDPRGSCMEPVD